MWEDDHSKYEAKSRWPRSVQGIFAWLQCYGLYVSVLGPQHPSRLSKMMAYQATIVPASRNNASLAYQRQAALNAVSQWSVINPTLYTLCLVGSARTSTRYELVSPPCTTQRSVPNWVTPTWA